MGKFTFEDQSNRGQPGGYPDLDGNGKVPNSQLPAIPTSGVETVVSGEGIEIDASDPHNPVISATGGSGGTAPMGDDDWIPLALQNGFTALGDTVPAYRKDALGVVHLKGAVEGAAGTDRSFAVLPEEYRPDDGGVDFVTPLGSSASEVANVSVFPNGTVVILSTPYTIQAWLDVSFYAAGSGALDVQGEKGDKGDTGDQGPTGTSGTNGTNGIDGTNASISGVVAVNAARIPLENLALWLDASDKSSLTITEGVVTKISDRSGNGTDFTGTATISTNVARYNVLHFHNQQLAAATKEPLNFLHQEGSTVFAVVRSDGGTGGDGALISIGGGGVGYQLDINSNYYGTADLVVLGSAGDIVTLVTAQPGPQPNIGQLSTVTAKSDPTNATPGLRGFIRVDGVDRTGVNDRTGTVSLTDSETTALVGGGDTAFYLAELIVYRDLLSDNDIVWVENYLNRKWFGSQQVDYVDPTTGTAQDALQALIDLGLMKNS